MCYLQPEFSPSCGPFCAGCRVCCDIVLCDKIPASESKNCSRSLYAKRLIEALEDVRKRTEFLQKQLSSFENTSVGTQVDKFSESSSKLRASDINLTNTSLNSENNIVQKLTSFDDKSVSTEDRKSINDPCDPKEIMNLCLTMMKEIKEVRDSLKDPKKCKNCHSRVLETQQTLSPTKNCSKCKRIIRCYQNPQYSCSRGTSCYFKNCKDLYHPWDSEPRAFPRRREPTPEEIQNTWCCWPFF